MRLGKVRKTTNVIGWTVGLILALSAFGVSASEKTGPRLTLADAIRLAHTDSPAVMLADLALEEARTAYEVAKVNQVSQPSIIALRQAENAWRLARQNRELAQQDLTIQVAQAYFEVLRTQMALELAQRALTQSRAQLESTVVRHEQGMLSDVDLLAAQSQAATTELDLNRAKANLARARMNFNRLLGRELDADFEIVDTLQDLPTVSVDLDAALKSALENRVEIQRARDTVALRTKELEVSDHSYTPPLTLRNLQLALQRAQLELEEREIDIILEVRQNYQAVVEARDRLPIQEKNVTRAQESLRIAEIRFGAGLITSIDLIDAQRSAFQAEMQLIQTAFDYQTAVARFNRSAALPFGELGL